MLFICSSSIRQQMLKEEGVGGRNQIVVKNRVILLKYLLKTVIIWAILQKK